MSKKVKTTLKEMRESDVYDIFEWDGIKMIQFVGFYYATDWLDDCWKEKLGAPRYACYNEERGVVMPLKVFIDKYGRSWDRMWGDGWDLNRGHIDDLTYKAFLESAKKDRALRKRLDYGNLTIDTPIGEYYNIFKPE